MNASPGDSQQKLANWTMMTSNSYGCNPLTPHSSHCMKITLTGISHLFTTFRVGFIFRPQQSRYYLLTLLLVDSSVAIKLLLMCCLVSVCFSWFKLSGDKPCAETNFSLWQRHLANIFFVFLTYRIWCWRFDCWNQTDDLSSFSTHRMCVIVLHVRMSATSHQLSIVVSFVSLTCAPLHR